MDPQFDTELFVAHLKRTTSDGSVHARIDAVHAEFVSTTRGEADVANAIQQLQRVCGGEVVKHAIACVRRPNHRAASPMEASMYSAMAPPPPMTPTSHTPMNARARDLSGMTVDHPQPPQGNHPQPSEASSDMDVVPAEPATLEVSRVSLDAWNHAIYCSVFDLDKAAGSCNAELHCDFEMCDLVRPSLLHRWQTRNKGIVGKCLEGCKPCGFYMRLKEATSNGVPTEKMIKFQEKKKRLIQLFAGLLLAHHGQGDAEMVELYKHVMGCNHHTEFTGSKNSVVTGKSKGLCRYRNKHGSCRTSMQLLYHFKLCRTTKKCALCSQLPPKLRRLKKRRSTMPVPLAVSLNNQRSGKGGRRRKRNEAAPTTTTTQASTSRAAAVATSRAAAVAPPPVVVGPGQHVASMGQHNTNASLHNATTSVHNTTASVHNATTSVHNTTATSPMHITTAPLNEHTTIRSANNKGPMYHGPPAHTQTFLAQTVPATAVLHGLAPLEHPADHDAIMQEAEAQHLPLGFDHAPKLAACHELDTYNSGESHVSAGASPLRQDVSMEEDHFHQQEEEDAQGNPKRRVVMEDSFEFWFQESPVSIASEDSTMEDGDVAGNFEPFPFRHGSVDWSESSGMLDFIPM